MSDYFESEAHRRSYFPLCAYNIVVSCLSVGFSLWVVVSFYRVGCPILKMEGCLTALCFLWVATVFHCNFMITTGSVLWLRISIGILIGCLLIVVPAIGYQQNSLVYALAGFFPLLGLLSFNSNRHRQFCRDFRDFRHQRASAQKDGGESARIVLGISSLAKRQNKTSKRETAITNRLRDQAEKAAVRRRQAKNKVTYPIAAVLVLALIALLGYSIYDSLMSGVVFLGGKGGPIQRYSVVTQPGLYWFAISLYAVMVVMGVVGLRLMLFFYKLEALK